MITAVDEAARFVHEGKVIAYPTEAVWGLGCDPDNPQALEALLRLKHRDSAKGVILIAADMAQLAPWLEGLDDSLLKALKDSWPAPLTWLVPDNGRSHPLVTGAHDKVALRVTPHPLVIQLCNAVGGPIVSTSANRASEPSAMTSKEVRSIFGSELGYVLEGETGGRSQPSDIRDLISGKWLRQG